ncbi:MAG: CoA pyrophosphatase [Microthrixaceae bacterium]|nr:CoA pyrophosphatase [Microthrixaceae bacterium]
MVGRIDDQPEQLERGGAQVIPRPTLWRPGHGAPWAGLDSPESLITPDRVRAAVPKGRSGIESPVKELGAKQFAVLVPVYGEGKDMTVVLTRRAGSLRTHSGEVSFPGGRAEPGEDAIQTALREANEEVGLDPYSVETLGELDHLTTVTRRAYIVPVVGLLDGPPSGPVNAAEVDKELHVPVTELLRPDVFREELWGTSEFNRPVYFFELYGDTVWGATAALLRQFLAMVTGTDPGDGVAIDPARGMDAMHFDLYRDGMDGVV